MRRLPTTTREPAWVRPALIATAIGFVGMFALVPLAAGFQEALRAGLARTAGPWSVRRRWPRPG